MDKLKPLIVAVDRVKPLPMGNAYDSRMILDHVITGRDGVIQVNHGTVKPRSALGGSAHEKDEIYYILSGRGKLRLDDEVVEIGPDQVIFIPGGVFHALDNTGSDEDLKILTFWQDFRDNEAYQERLERWGKSFKTIDEE
jgi:mannose-6-phosphate isomerase-like protein (cupin superfamily)